MKRLRPGGVLRLTGLGAATLALLPMQMAAIRFGPAWRIPRLFHKLVCRSLGVRIVQRGTPPAAGGLIVANHVSWLDIPVIGSLGPLSFVSKAEVADWPIVGLLSKLQRTVFIDRTRRSATAEVAGQMGSRLAAGEAVVLFAEGTTGDGTRILPLRSSLLGAAHEALGAEAAGEITIYPLTITYTGWHGLPGGRAGRSELAWYGDTELTPHLRAILARGAIDVELAWGEPIRMDRATSRKQAARHAEQAIREARRAVVSGRAETISIAAVSSGTDPR